MIPPIANRFIAGEDISDAVAHADTLYDTRGVKTILNRLGEHYHTTEAVDEDTDHYVDALNGVIGDREHVRLSVKPSQVGSEVNETLFRDNMGMLVQEGCENDTIVWMDMESIDTTQTVISTFQNIAYKNPGWLGVCLQANLRRTPRDVDDLIDVPGDLRLVKGAYDESRDVAYKSKDKVDEQYREVLRTLFQERKNGIAVATHDEDMIALAKDLHDEYGTPFEFQMLMGVKEDLQTELVDDGYEVWQYAPYGSGWMPYFYRRVRERRANAVFAVKAVIDSVFG